MTPDMAQGRSRLLRGGLVAAGRHRDLRRRRLVVGTILGALAAFVIVFTLRIFPPNGPFVAVYLLHDRLWLPFHAQVWVGPYPFGLLWLLPLVTGLVLVGAEYLGFGQPLRRAQVWLVETLLRRGWTGLLLRAGRQAEAQGGPEGSLIGAVLDDHRHAAREAVLAGAGGEAQKLVQLQGLMLALRPRSRTEALVTVEVLALCRLQPGPDTAGLRAALMAQWPDLGGVVAAWDQAAAPRDLTAEAAGLAQLGAEQAALATLDIVLRGEGSPATLVWFDLWSAARYAGGPVAARLAEAEALIAFEFWAAAAQARVPVPQPDPLFAEALPALSLVRDRGEIAAAGAGVAR